ncbi:pali-domain-containing protein [Atractiella rhizophila]|nr:pali-domain-containing protein [Atractiella rhizophila]
MSGLSFVGIFLLFSATGLLVIASITAPEVKRFYFLEAFFQNATFRTNVAGTVKVTFGSFGYCIRQYGFKSVCTNSNIGYSKGLLDELTVNGSTVTGKLVFKLTKALILHPVAAGISFFAFLLALSTNPLVDILASVVSLLGVATTSAAFVLDSIIFIIARNRFDDLRGGYARLHRAYYFTAAAAGLQLIAAFFVLCGHFRRRREIRTSPFQPYRPPQRIPMSQRWPMKNFAYSRVSRG